MVKFSKQFEGQLVPEWKEAFVDYNKLKKCLKKIHLLNTNTNTNTTTKLTKHILLSSLKKFSPFGLPRRDVHRPIQVHKTLASSPSKDDVYETEVIEQFADTDGAKEFFFCLDLELNKVNQFYKAREREFLERADSLKEQIRILIQHREGRVGDDSSISFDAEKEYSRGRAEEDMVITDELEGNGVPLTASSGQERSLMVAEAGDEAKKMMKISIPLTTPTRTLSAMSELLRGYSDGPKLKQINKSNLRRAEKMIKEAIVELYKGLDHLKTYRHLNMLAFLKILKKFDKVTGKQVLPIYLKVVESSYINCSDKIVKLADEVEELFIKHFTKDDKRKGVKHYLKPRQPLRKESHVVTFFIGLFTGCFIALLAGYIVKADVTNLYKQKSDSVYMETIYPLLSMFSLLFLHLFLYGCDMFMWRKMRINYSFMFELSPTEELTYRDVFLICATSMTLVMGVMFAHLTLIQKGCSYSRAQSIPALLVLTFLLILISPFKIFYRSSRYRFLCTLRNVVLAPFYKVVLLDFFLAEQLCSQVPMLRNLEYIACYYITGSYRTVNYGVCRKASHFRDISYAVSFLPYYWRAMQCGRRWFDEGEAKHLVNLGKYVSAMLAAGAKMAYEREKSVGWLCLLVGMSTVATVYQLYWDYVEDWGLLRPHSKNPWLRDNLIFRRKFIYYISMGLNLVLRLAWLQTVLPFSFGNVDYRLTNLFLAALEVIRRGQGSFYRLENEHMNNVGKFRAVKTVPLPFHEVDDAH